MEYDVLYEQWRRVGGVRENGIIEMMAHTWHNRRRPFPSIRVLGGSGK